MTVLNTFTELDRRRLREIVRRVHLAHYPKEHITDYEADRVIEAMAPGTAEYLIQEGVDSGFVEG